MNPALPFIPKNDPELPDQYGLKVHYLTGGAEDFELVRHKIFQETQTLEILTDSDEWRLIPLNGIKKIELDKRFSKIVALKEKAAKE